ncbi:hypothetical protein [Candidimonas nitroreducens]|nr:hypothetical protein [Candidimonas nitroreducens]
MSTLSKGRSPEQGQQPGIPEEIGEKKHLLFRDAQHATIDT